jgi:acyl-coenzyme A synthetase/AMP-(fatty) acid ligase
MKPDAAHREVLPFWQRLADFGDIPAIVDGATGFGLTYRQLTSDVSRTAECLGRYQRTLVGVSADHTIAHICCYLGALASGHSVLLCAQHRGASEVPLLEHYRALTVSATLDCRESARQGPDLHADLALLVPTSGSTGALKFARLSYRNLCVSALQVGQALRLDQSERVLLSLPLDHIYGISTLHAGLASGSTIVLCQARTLDRVFWEIAARQKITFIPSVPTQLRLIRQIGGAAVLPSSLRKISSTGSALDAETRAWLARDLAPRGTLIFSMYGMTEACGRMTVLQPEEFVDNPTSVGRPVEYGKIDISAKGEVVYSGPNVMLGYSRSPADLAAADGCGGVLETGDLGALDATGCLHIVGRSARITKICDRRVNLDELETCLSSFGEVAVVAAGDRVKIVCMQGSDQCRIMCRSRELARELRLPVESFEIVIARKSHRTASGKWAYEVLRSAGKEL